MRFPGKSLLALVLGSGPAALLAQAPPFGAEFKVNGSAIGASAEFFPAAASSGERELRRRLAEQHQDGSQLRRLRPALRQLRRAPRPRVPRQHLHDG